MPHTHHAGLLPWEIVLTMALVAAAVCYVRGWIQVCRLGINRVERWRGASFLLGLILTGLGAASPLATLDHQLLTVHMVQHLLLMTLAPPLIWLGAPEVLILAGFPQRLQNTISLSSRAVPVRPVGIAFRLLAASGTLIAWHIPWLFALGMRSEMWHAIEQATFFLTGLLFWQPVIRRCPPASNSSGWTILLYLFLATLPCDILSGFLVFCDRVVYPVYLSLPQVAGVSQTGFSVLEDQQFAGALMWTCVTIVYTIAGMVFAARLLSPQEVQRGTLVSAGPQIQDVAQKTRREVEIA
jgi:putative membrane protein